MIAHDKIEWMLTKLEKMMKPSRFQHSVRVMEEAVRLAKTYGCDEDKAEVAGLLHDCAKGLDGEALLKACKEWDIPMDEVTAEQPELLHGPVGSHIAEIEFGVSDKDILEAIRWHTTGCRDMGLLTKIIYLADFTEQGRTFPGVESLRNAADNDLDIAVRMAMDSTIAFVLAKNGLLHRDTIEARNYLLLEKARR